MPYAYRVSKVSIIGTMFGGTEDWTTGFYFGNAGADAQLPTQALADHIRDAWTTAITNGNFPISNQVQCTEVKISSIGTDGKSNPADTVYSNFATTAKGQAPFNVAPQLSLVIRLNSAAVRGLSAHGRMYLPLPTAGLDGTGHLNTIDVGHIQTVMQTFFHTVNDNTISPNVMVNASQGQLTRTKPRVPKVGGLGPITKEITGFQVGNVLDTQRRRSDGFKPVFVTGTVF